MNAPQLIADTLYGPEVTNAGLHALMRSIGKGRLDEDEARTIIEYAPRLADMLMQGLGGIYGEVGPKRLIELAKAGQINGGVLSRAMT